MTELPNVTIAAEDGVVIASLTGEIDLSNATEITDALLGGVPNEALAPAMRIERSKRGTVVTMRRALRGPVSV